MPVEVGKMTGFEVYIASSRDWGVPLKCVLDKLSRVQAKAKKRQKTAVELKLKKLDEVGHLELMYKVK